MSVALVVILGIGALIAETGGLPNPYVHLYYPVILYVAFLTPMPWPLVTALLAGFIPSHEGLLHFSQLADDPTAVVRPLIFLTVAVIVNRWAGRIWRQAEAERNLSQRLLHAQEEERRRLAYDIHDGPSQQIVAADMYLESYRAERRQKESPQAESYLERAKSYLSAAIRETRRIVSDLRPSVLDDFGLAEALRHYLEEVKSRAEIQVEFETNMAGVRLDPAVETALFRIAQEAVTNAVKHSQTDRLRVSLQKLPLRCVLEVRDWGRGFEVARVWETRDERQRIGLVSMRERAELVGGRLQMVSAPGRGTSVRVELPLRDQPSRPRQPDDQQGVKEMTGETPKSGTPGGKALRVLIADDHPMVRQGLRTMLNTRGITVVGEASTGREAVERVRELRPDVVLMDVRMPDMDGLVATEIVKREAPNTSVIILTSYESKDYLRRAIEAGAAGYLLKDTARDTIIEAVRLVRGGGSLIDAKLLGELLQEMGVGSRLASGAEGALEALTHREQQVLRLLVKGLTNKEIAAQMHYSVGTVKNVVQRVIEKLGVSDRTQAAVLAVRAGIEPE